MDLLRQYSRLSAYLENRTINGFDTNTRWSGAKGSSVGHVQPSLSTSRHRRLSSSEAAELVARYRGGEKIKDLAASYKIHRSTAMAHLRKAGELKHKGWTDETTAEARWLRDAGLTIAEIAVRLGRPPSTVQRRLSQKQRKWPEG